MAERKTSQVDPTEGEQMSGGLEGAESRDQEQLSREPQGDESNGSEVSSHFREDYLARRRQKANNNDPMLPDAKESSDVGMFYDFYDCGDVRTSISHFEHRNLTWATSEHDVYIAGRNDSDDGSATLHWNSSERKTTVDDLKELQIKTLSALCAKGELVVIGGSHGEIAVKNITSNKVLHRGSITTADNTVTNSIDLCDNRIIACSSERHIRIIDLQTFEIVSSFPFQVPVNHASQCPGGRWLVVACDDNPIQVIDGDNGRRIASLTGHEQPSFVTAWHPEGNIFATGSQDRTCRVWDARNMSESMSVLRVRSSAVKSLDFSSDGQVLAIAEANSFFRVFEREGGMFERCQEYFVTGDVSGCSFTPSSDGLFIGICDEPLGRLIEFRRDNT